MDFTQITSLTNRQIEHSDYDDDRKTATTLKARNFVQLKIVKAFREYRNLYNVQHRLGGRMIYPESLKFLALYGLTLFKSTALRGGHADVQLDERWSAGCTMMDPNSNRPLIKDEWQQRC
ncbi:unnamed protein product [Ilex paraguariensis]|uniref:Sec23/Sec24 helical domain-containing protein n=1 Tax=Ilex paraguariensis TaxID=185542 RepID=A0ABC8UDH1_9AQUA